jgi:hypothetical protein
MSAEPLEMLLREFCLTTMAARCAEMLQNAEAQNWGYRKFLLQLCEAEAAEVVKTRYPFLLDVVCQVRFAEEHQAIRVPKGQRAQEDLVHQAE